MQRRTILKFGLNLIAVAVTPVWAAETHRGHA